MSTPIDTPTDEAPVAPVGPITVTTPVTAPAQKVFTEDEVAAIRKQEKDKLYGEIEAQKAERKAMEERLGELQSNIEAFNTDRLSQKEAEDQARAAAEAERKAREESEMEAKDLIARRETEFNARLEESENKWAKQFEEIQQHSQAQEALLEKERAYAAMSEYKQSVLAQHSDDIMPHLHSLVTGNTTEEIDASVSSAIQLTSAIIEDMSQATAMRGPRGIPATGASPTGPMENHSSQQHLTAEDIRQMSIEQYEQLRPQLLQQARPQR